LEETPSLLRNTITVFVPVPLFVRPAVTAATLTFETLAEGTIVTTQYAGVTFANATVLTAGGGPKGLEFPPRGASRT